MNNVKVSLNMKKKLVKQKKNFKNWRNALRQSEHINLYLIFFPAA